MGTPSELGQGKFVLVIESSSYWVLNPECIDFRDSWISSSTVIMVNELLDFESWTFLFKYTVIANGQN